MIKGLDIIIDKLQQARGIDFSGYRPDTLKRRISARLAKLGLDDLTPYLQQLENDPSEYDHLIDAITINVSTFFRDPIVFEIIAQKILPEIIDKKNRTGSREIRVWSAGCAAGDEPYSMAILIQEALKKDDKKWTIHIFGTDIDKSTLQQAEKAAYLRETLVNTKLGILDKHFDSTADGFKLKPSVKKMVSFSRDDLTSTKTFSPAESVFGEFDIILCRNVLIYFNQDLQNLVMNKFKRAMVPGGYLVLGDSETMNKEAGLGFRFVDSKNRIYKKHMV